MSTLDFNFSDVPDSLRLSDVPYTNKKQNGGFSFFGLFDNKISKIDKMALEAASEKDIGCLKRFIVNDLIDDYSSQDKDGNTILHYIVAAPEPDIELIKTILHNSNAKKFINIQNNRGDTPLLVSAKGGHHDICELLEKNGASKKIKNNDGYHVDTESEHNTPVQESRIPDSQVPDSQIPDSQIPKASNNDIHKILFRTQKQEQYTDTFTDFKPANKLPQNLESDLDAELKEITKEKNSKLQSGGCGSCAPSCSCAQRGGCGESCIPSCPCAQRGGCPLCGQSGGCGCGMRGGKSKTDSIITDIHKSFMNQLGGKQTGSRNLKRSDNSTDLARMLDNQASEIINRVVKKIQDIMADNKKDFKGLKSDEATARAIKSLIWSGLRKEYEGVKKSSLDIATEMENRVNVDYIKKYDKTDIENMSKTLKQHADEKEKRKSQTTSDNKINMNKAASETSSD